MRVPSPLICLLFLVLAFAPVKANTPIPAQEAAKLLPNQVGDFRARGAAREHQDTDHLVHRHLLQGDDILSAAMRDYVSSKGERFNVFLIKTRTESAAYALLTKLPLGEYKYPVVIQRGQVGSASVSVGHLYFFQGSALIGVAAMPVGGVAHNSLEREKVLARALAETLAKGEGDIPVLVKHLPDWERVHERATYSVTFEGLQNIGREPVFEAIDFAGGTEAVSANYDSSRLVIFEFTTPQLATDNDRRIVAKLQELRGQGKPLPSAYRRVGNYAVFVFNSSSEQAANELVDQIKYEQVTKWLGDSPYPLLEAQRKYRDTTLGMLVSVVKASGIALVMCLSVGGLFGGLLFLRRRTQQKSVEAFTDAGGMMRLNLDEMTPQTNPARLIGRGD